MKNEKMARYMKRRRHEFRRSLLRRLGGRCEWCGTEEDLVFDHIDPDTKEIDPCHLGDYNKEKREQEIEKLQILCISCHGSKNHEDGKSLMRAPRSCVECRETFADQYALAGHMRWH